MIVIYRLIICIDRFLEKISINNHEFIEYFSDNFKLLIIDP